MKQLIATAALIAACSNASNPIDGGLDGTGPSGTIQCGPSLQCTGTQLCWMPSLDPNPSQATCGNPPDDGGSPWQSLGCTNRSVCAPDQHCCLDYTQGIRCYTDSSDGGVSEFCTGSGHTLCASSAECVAPMTCLTDKNYPWLQSCQ